MRERIEFLVTKEVPFHVVCNNRFEFNKSKGWVLLQKICFFVLRKIGCFVITNEPKVTRHVIEYKTFSECLYKMREEVFRRCMEAPSRLIIGTKDFYNLMGDPEIKRLTTFTIKLEGYRGNSNYPTIMDLSVTVVPWMSGMVVLP